MPIIVNLVQEKWFLVVSIGFSKGYKNLLNNTCKMLDRIAFLPRSVDTPAFKIIFMVYFVAERGISKKLMANNATIINPAPNQNWAVTAHPKMIHPRKVLSGNLR